MKQFLVKRPIFVGFIAITLLLVSRCTADSPAPESQFQTFEPTPIATGQATAPTEVPEQISTQTPTVPSAQPTSAAAVEVGEALLAAQSLVERGRAPATGYDRDQFGSAWKDVDRNGCDTRNDILARDFATVDFKPGSNGCKVIGGTWTDPYSNETYTFDSQPSEAQIDHVVSLKNAWQMGADLWSNTDRLLFANDPLNLRVTIASLNRQKSDANAASWLPPYKPGRCAFIAQQVAVKKKWNLYVTSPEKVVMVQILSLESCAGTVLPK